MNFESNPKNGPYLAQVAILLVGLLAAVSGIRWLWGAHHLAYLSPAWTGVWALAAFGLLLPPVQRSLARFLDCYFPGLFLEGLAGPVILLVLTVAGFFFLRERTFFMGDGYLLGEFLEQGRPFRTFDAMDYLLHVWVFKWLREIHPVSPFSVFQAGSILAGALGVGLVLAFTRKLDWEGWRKSSLVLLLLTTGPVALFYGHVESYAFLFAFLTCFLILGLLALDGRVPVWLASLFLGLGLFFHLTAVFSGPALLVLAWKSPGRPAARRWGEALLPPLGLMSAALLVHLALGYDADWFATEVLESPNAQGLLVKLGGPWGLFSLNSLQLHLNLILITAPACLVLLLSRVGWLREHAREPRIMFLLVQVLTVAVAGLLIDRKLGGARDWDLLAAHAAGLVLLAVLSLPTARSAALVLSVSLLMSAPWIALQSREDESVTRFAEVAAGFAPYPRGYAYEGLGKYYRDRGETRLAVDMYRQAAEANPGHARFHSLLAASLVSQANATGGDPDLRRQLKEQAEDSYREALRLDPANATMLDNLARLLLQRSEFDEAVAPLEKVVQLQPDSAKAWTVLGYCYQQLGRFEESVSAFDEGLERGGISGFRRFYGAALSGLGRYPEAAVAFGEALDAREPRAPALAGYADCVLAWAESQAAAGQVPERRLTRQANRLLERLQEISPRHYQIPDLTERLAALATASAEDR